MIIIKKAVYNLFENRLPYTFELNCIIFITDIDNNSHMGNNFYNQVY